MSVPAPDRDLSLLGLAEHLQRYAGRIEELDDDSRLLMLGLFEGAVSRLFAALGDLHAQAASGDIRTTLHQVFILLGADDDYEPSRR